jgi:hypothetical protein
MRTIIYSDVIAAAAKMAAIMLPGFPIDVDTKGGFGASVVRHAGTYRVSLPSYHATARLPRDAADYVLGLLIHELAHVRYTVMAHKPGVSRAVQRMTNALEDVRIERETINSGTPDNAAQLLAHVTEKLAGFNTQHGWTGSYAGQAALLACIAGRVANPDYGDLPLATGFASQAPAWLRTIIDRHLPAIERLGSTPEAYTLAETILSEVALEEPKEKTEEPEDDETGETGDQPGEGETGEGETGETGETEEDSEGTETEEDSEGTETEAGSGESEGQDDAEGDAEGEAGETGETETDHETETETHQEKGNKDAGKPRKGSRSNDNPGTTKGPEMDTEVDAVLKEIAKSLTMDTRPDLTGALVEMDHAKGRHTAQSVIDNYRSQGMARVGELRRLANSAGVAPKVRQMLHSQDDSLMTRYETRGRLDRRALARIETGDARVFTRRGLADGIRTGVAFLLDMSSSMMDGRRDLWQGSAVVALAEACERGGADVKIDGFGPAPQSSYGGQLLPFKPWDKRMADGLAAMAGHPSSYGTNLAPSLLMAASELADREGLHKRILLVLTDGECQYGSDLVRAAAELAAAKYGVTVVGIGIQIDLTRTFPKSATVRDLATLGTTMMSELLKAVG